MAEGAPLVSVVIANRNRQDDLRRALQSIREQTYQNIEVIVVDDGSTDGAPDMVRKEFSKTRLIELGGSGSGACRTFNTGLRAARGELVAMLDNDATVEPGWVAMTVERFRERPRLGAVATKIINEYKGFFQYDYDYWPEYHDRPEYPIYTFRGCGCTVRRELLDRVGLFPEEFFIYMNEDDLAARIWGAGFDIVYFDDLVTHHHPSKVQRPGEWMLFYPIRNKILTYTRYLSVKGAVVHIGWALLRDFIDVLKAKDPLPFIRGALSGLKNLPRFAYKRAYSPRWERVMWENEMAGRRRRGKVNKLTGEQVDK
jgi:GT2 family glycosyltransferase